jgi:hypothetical protein
VCTWHPLWPIGYREFTSDCRCRPSASPPSWKTLWNGTPRRRPSMQLVAPCTLLKESSRGREGHLADAPCQVVPRQSGQSTTNGVDRPRCGTSERGTMQEKTSDANVSLLRRRVLYPLSYGRV